MPPRRKEPAKRDELTLEEAKQIVQFAGHFNFGRNIEARRHYYERKAEAKRIVLEAGYTLAEEAFGHRITNLN